MRIHQEKFLDFFGTQWMKKESIYKLPAYFYELSLELEREDLYLKSPRNHFGRILVKEDLRA